MHVRSVIIGGIVASLVIGMWEMVVEAVLPDGAGFFGPAVAIGATVSATSRARATRFHSTEWRSCSVWQVT